MEKKSSRFGIAAFVLAIVGFCTAFIGGIGVFFDAIAIVFALIACFRRKGKAWSQITAFAIAGVSLIVYFSVLSGLNALSDSLKTETATEVSSDSSTASNNENENESSDASENNTKDSSEDKVEYEITFTNAVLYKNSIGTVWASVIAEVTNTGSTDLFLESASIDLEDTSGSLIKTLSMVSVYPQIISPGEKGYYYENTTLDDVSADASLSILLHPDIEKSKTDKVTFPVTDIKIADDTFGGIEAIGRVENTSSEDESMLYVSVVLYDSGDKPIAVLFTIVDVKAGDKLGFTASSMGMPDDIKAESVARFEAFAYPTKFQF